MRIIVIGAGVAGYHLAEKLCDLGHNIVLIDNQAAALAGAESQLDILTIQGNGSTPSVLQQAEITKADLVLAVTNCDEVNILACAYAKAAGVPYKVARVSNADYANSTENLDLRHIGPDLLICHKEESAQEMYNILRRPGTLGVVDLLGGRMLSVGIKVGPSSPLIGIYLKAFPEDREIGSLRFIAIIRECKLLIPSGDTCVRENDEIYVVTRPDDVDEFLDWACPDRIRFEKLVIAGGGDIGLRLAQLLENNPVNVILVEADKERANYCSGKLKRALVIVSDTLDGETLEEIGVVKNTAFVATTGDDENNIIGCLLAQKLGACFTMAKVTKSEYAPVIDSLNLLDRVVSPQQTMINAILHFVRGQNVTSATLLHKMPGEVLELVIPHSSTLVGKAIKDAKFPKGTIIAAVLRNEEDFIPTGGLVLEHGDHLVVFAIPDCISKLKKFMQK